MNDRPQGAVDAQRSRGKLRRWRLGRLGPRRDPELAAMLAGQISAARDGIVLARAMADKEITPAQARTRIAEVERQGDEMRAQLVEQLSRTLVAPLDREDLFRLSRSIDDVLDTIRDFLREADMYHIEQRASYLPLLDGVEVAIDALGTAIATMWTAPHEVPLMGLAAKKAARQVNRAYQDGFAKIVGGDMTPAAIKRRELTKRLDWVGVRITEAANVLTDGALKRGY